MDVDPFASMRCWAIEIELGGHTFDVPALPAADWWPVLSSGDMVGILDFVASDPSDPFNLDEMLLAGSLAEGALAEALTDAVEVAAGRSLHCAFVLATVANRQWASINGALMIRGFRWDQQPLGAALDAIYAEVVDRLEKDSLTKFLALLDDESVTTGKKRRASKKARQEFETFAGPKPTTGVKSSGAPSDSARPKTQTQPQPHHRGDQSHVPMRPPVPPVESGPGANP